MDDIEFIVYNKGNSYRRRVVAKTSSTVLPANTTPVSTFTLDDDHDALPALTEKGARCAYRFRGVEWFRGRVGPLSGVGPRGTTTLVVEGDFRKLWDWQGSPKPTAAIATQTTIDEEYARYIGVTEAVFRSALVANFSRLGVPWTVAPSLGRGIPDQRVEFRFHPLAEKLIPLLDAANLLVQLSYHPTTAAVTVSLREAETLGRPLSELTGAFDDFDWSRNPPGATRATIGGAGEGVERQFLQVINAELEADWGDIIETFKDSRMADASADLSVDGAEALAELAPTVGVGLDLQETDALRFGETFLVGDRIPVKLGPLEQFTERITQVQIDDTPEDGVKVTPRLGEIENSADAELGAIVARLARGVRDQGRR